LNFLLHRHLAERDLGSGVAGIGAMLPDLWRMADRRVRPAAVDDAARLGAPEVLARVLDGIEHHVRSDRWFHGAAVFTAGERLTFEQMRDAGLSAPKIALFAHVTWELCLDGALIRREGLEGILDALRRGFGEVRGEPVDEAAARHHFDRFARTPEERQAFSHGMERLFTELALGPWVAGYQTGAGIARRIEGMRVRLGFARFAEDERPRLARVLDAIAPHADAALAEILSAPSAV
jgi:hypothetical protein